MRHVTGIALSIFALFPVFPAAAQQSSYQKLFFADVNTVDGTATYHSADSAAAPGPVCCSAQVVAPGKYDIVVLMLDTAGNVAQCRMLTRNPSFHDWVTACMRTDNGYFLTGSSRGFDTSAMSNESSYLVRLDDSLHLAAQTNYYLPGHELFAKDMAMTQGHDLLITGNSVFNGNWSFFLLKADTAGNVVWFRRYTPAADAVAVRELDNGDIMVCGSFPYAFQYIQPVAMRFDANGNPLWAMNYIYATGPFDLQNSSLAFIHDYGNGRLLLAGRTDFSSTASLGGMDAYMLLVDDNGMVVRSRTFGRSQGDWPYDYHVSADGKLHFAGGTNSFFNQSGFGFILAADTSGMPLDAFAFGDTTIQEQITLTSLGRSGMPERRVAGYKQVAGTFDLYAADLRPGPGGSCPVYPVVFQAMDASSYPVNAFSLFADSSLVPVTDHAMFSTYTGIGDSVLCASPTGVQEHFPAGMHVLCPNPVTETQFSITAEWPIDAVDLYDAAGRLVLHTQPHRPATVLPSPERGLYVLHIACHGRTITKKLIVAR